VRATCEGLCAAQTSEGVCLFKIEEDYLHEQWYGHCSYLRHGKEQDYNALNMYELTGTRDGSLNYFTTVCTPAVADTTSATTIADCTPGQFMFGDKSALGARSCIPCPAGHSSTKPNSAECTPHTGCAAGQSVTRLPSSSQDRHCANCADGSFSARENSDRCEPHTTCARNFYVVNLGSAPSRTANRKCEPCQLNMISNGSNAEKCTSIYDFSTLEGKWVLVASNAELEFSQTMAIDVEHSAEIAEGIQRGLESARENEDGMTVGIMLGTEREQGTGAEVTNTHEDCTDTTDETEERGQVSAKVSGGAFGVTAEISGEYENTNTGSTETHTCHNKDSLTSEDTTETQSKDEEQERSKSLMRTMSNNLEKTLESTLSEMKSSNFATSKTVSVTCGRGDEKPQNTWQWVVVATPSGGEKKSPVQIPTDRFMCVGNANKAPMCPPENCGDAECTCCNSASFLSPWMRPHITLCQCIDERHVEIAETFKSDGINDCDGAVIRGYCHASTIPAGSDALTEYSPAALARKVQDNCPCTCGRYGATTTATSTTASTTASTTTTRAATRPWMYEDDYTDYQDDVAEGNVAAVADGQSNAGVIVGAVVAVIGIMAVVLLVIKPRKSPQAANEDKVGSDATAPTDATVIQVEAAVAPPPLTYQQQLEMAEIAAMETQLEQARCRRQQQQQQQQQSQALAAKKAMLMQRLEEVANAAAATVTSISAVDVALEAESDNSNQ
jgi:hypothetical protein